MLRIALIAVLALVVVSCSKTQEQGREQAEPAPEVLIQVGDSVLTRARVLSLLPAGISRQDSLRLFDAIVEEWLERNMLTDVAVKNLPDMEKIDRLVEQYRRRLLAEEYRRLMAEEYSDKVAPQAVKNEYDSHPEKYLLASPVVKGIYVKLPANSPQLSEVRAWVKAATAEAIDELENYGLKGAMEYEYFGDKWIPWEELSSRIPYRFPSPESMAATDKNFETQVDGITYMFHITQALPAGEKMPFDYASPIIEQELIERNREDYDRRLLRDIYAREVDNRRIHQGTYIPLRYRDVKPK